jgi:diguanylate cyclase (GGDEF)-like protein
MQHDVLIVESQPQLVHVLTKQVVQAGLNPIVAYSLDAAKTRFLDSVPESILCAIVGYLHVDGEPGEGINYFTSVSVPTIAVSASMSVDVRKHVLHYEIVDYVGLENAQTVDYLLRLIQRLNKNKRIGVLLYTSDRKTQQQTKSLLQRHSFKIYTCADKQTTKDILLNNQDIQMVMLDADSQEHNLSEFVADIRKTATKDDIAIVGLSRKRADFQAAHFIKCGATDFFTLPFDHEEFLLRVMQMLEAIEHVAVIRQTANQDYLTGLPNRRHFFYSVNKLHPSQINQQALALIDLDHFKKINDTYGHDAGDAVLKNTARLIATAFEHGHVARFGGEEFCIYLNNESPDAVLEDLNKLRQLIESSPVSFGTQLLNVTTSIGVTFTSQSNIEAMLSKADALLYEAKHQGRNQVCDDALR